jgi:hypothetical protein
MGHLQLSEENRRIVLSMSAATADRLLRTQRLHCLRSLSTTKAGPLLKQQIPIRTFEDWNEAKPGFSGSRPGGSLWLLHPGKFPLHAHAHGCGDWMDRMSPRAQPWTRGGARRLATRSHTVPVSCPGNGIVNLFVKMWLIAE